MCTCTEDSETRNEFEIMPVPHSGASFGQLYSRKMLKRLLELVLENCLYLAEMCFMGLFTDGTATAWTV